jgi:hypothetical protein
MVITHPPTPTERPMAATSAGRSWRICRNSRSDGLPLNAHHPTRKRIRMPCIVKTSRKFSWAICFGVG